MFSSSAPHHHHILRVSSRRAFAPRDFSPGTPVVSSPLKPTFPNSNSIRNQVDEVSLSGCVASKSLLFSFVHRQSSTTASFICLNENEPTGSTVEAKKRFLHCVVLQQ